MCELCNITVKYNFMKFENLCLPHSYKFEKIELFFCSILKTQFHNAKQKIFVS